MKNIKLDPEKISVLTEVESGYKRFNINMVDFYSGLHPALLSKIAHILFNCILSNKTYSKADQKDYNENEAKRIFTNILILPPDLVQRMNPLKFANNKSDVETDISNLLKKLQELEDNNIFYIWRFKQPFTYIFIMERDITSWKYYNKTGFLYPKSLKKIVRLSKSMISTMVDLEKQRGRISTQVEIENSFGEFLNKLIEKMAPAVSVSLPRWQNNENILTYTSNLLDEASKENNFEGCIYDANFIAGLPEHIKKKIIKTHKEDIKMSTRSELEQELVPANENLVRIKKRSITNKSPIKQKISVSSVSTTPTIDAEEVEFKKCNPFNSPLDFLKYYRSFLRILEVNTKFYPFHTELPDSGEILDLLILNGKNKDIRFLRFWIKFYFLNYLKGNNSFKEEKTCLKSFKQTFNVYIQKYIS